jgi:hypothetical protein
MMCHVPGHRNEIDTALAELAGRVADTLAADGWVRRELASFRLASYTLEIQGGVIAAAELDRTSFGWPDHWPVPLRVRVGVGFEPALGLMPLLTLQPDPSVLEAGEPLAVALDGVGQVAEVSRQVAAFINRQAVPFAEGFADARAIADALQAEREDPSETETFRQYNLRLELTLLAASSRRDEVRALLPAYQSSRPEDWDLSDRRFVRQLTRWLDSGATTVPPIADTLALLPTRHRSERPSFSDVRQRAKGRREALDAVRANSKGKTLAELTELVTLEYGNRGLELAPSAAALSASMLQTEQQPFGRVLSAVRAVQALKSYGGDTIRLFKSASDDPPAWLEPPDRASYVVPTIGMKRQTTVELDAEAQPWLNKVVREAARPLGQVFLIDVWLDVDEAGLLVAHVGPRRVGRLSPSDTAAFGSILRAAALFDEDPLLGGRLSRQTPESPWLLEIPVPADSPAAGEGTARQTRGMGMP